MFSAELLPNTSGPERATPRRDGILNNKGVTLGSQGCTPEELTCGFPVVLQHFAEHQFVGVQAKRVPEHADRHQEHVTVGALRLRRARAIEIPLRDICEAEERQSGEQDWEKVSLIWIMPSAGGLDPGWSAQRAQSAVGRCFLASPDSTSAPRASACLTPTPPPSGHRQDQTQTLHLPLPIQMPTCLHTCLPGGKGRGSHLPLPTQLMTEVVDEENRSDAGQIFPLLLGITPRDNHSGYHRCAMPLGRASATRHHPKHPRTLPW